MNTKITELVAQSTPAIKSILLSVLLLISTGVGFAQSRITSPPANSVLGYPGFTLIWGSVTNADEYQLQFGSAQGKYDYFQGSMGRQTSINYNWPNNRPAGFWVRLWTHITINSGTAKSTPMAQYWTYSDTYFKLAPATQTVDARTMLINDYLAATSALAASSHPFGGQCKAFLAGYFNSVGKNYRLPNGNPPVMPDNPYSNEGTGVRNWYWSADANSGWAFVDDVKPDNKDKYNAVMTLLRKVRKGDTLQLVMRSSKTLPANKTDSYVPHTIAFRADYTSDSKAMDWVDSNMDNKGTASAGTVWPWGEAKTPSTLAERIGLQYGACTLYHVRDGISKR